MKKKTISMILGMMLALSVFGGCGSTGTAAPSDGAVTEAAADAQAAVPDGLT